MVLVGRFFIVLFLAISTLGYGQSNETSNDTLTLDQRLKIFRETLNLDEEKFDLFKETYTKYQDDQKRAFRCSFLTLDNLAKIAGGLNQAEALECLNTLLVNSDEDRKTRDRYFEFIRREIDPKTADQFLQIELGFEKTYVNLLRRRVLAENFPKEHRPVVLSIIDRIAQG